MTEKDNQFSVLKAHVVEEANPGTKVYDLTRPDAKTYDKGKVITLEAKHGVYTQETQVLDLKPQVVANYNKQMTIKTNSATYNFATEFGFGNEKVTGEGEKGSFEANKFTFDKNKGQMTLIENVYLKSGEIELTTPEKATLFLNDNK
ncbi:MAG: LPS export ABC transporter periplasmic protein LptC, partial [Alphaproteobacteria bacterium]|nr:LPS export ABC transporter periplasmic protein LptC [Alphaproteobacteria bacterium]